MLKAQLTFLGTAFGFIAGSGLMLFRYRSASTYYADGDTVFGSSSSNYWKMSNVFQQYFFLAMGTIAFVT